MGVGDGGPVEDAVAVAIADSDDDILDMFATVFCHYPTDRQEQLRYRWISRVGRLSEM